MLLTSEGLQSSLHCLVEARLQGAVEDLQRRSRVERLIEVSCSKCTVSPNRIASKRGRTGRVSAALDKLGKSD